MADIPEATTWWNYRLVRHDGMINLYEVYYEDERPIARTEDPVTFGTDDDDPGVVVGALRNALSDAQDHPVLDDTDIGTGIA